MPISTNLSVSPYFDDFNISKDYYQVLFKPGVALQTRELNVLQSILQNQIEQFGDNIFTKGTIISGCNFQYYPNYPYIKLEDLQSDGTSVSPANYVGLYAVGSGSGYSNLVSYVLQANSGYVSQAPNLNTLFVRYLNSGNTGTQTAYNPGDTLTLYNSNNSIYKVNLTTAGVGTGFTNADSTVFMPAIVISNSAYGTNTVLAAQISAGYTINSTSLPAQAVITEVNTTAISGSLVLKLCPNSTDLANTNLTGNNNWTFSTSSPISIYNGATHVVDVNINNIIGGGASANVITNNNGSIINVVMTEAGSGYSIAPYVTVKTLSTSANISAVTYSTPQHLIAQNYLAKVTVASSANSGSSNPTGFGYAFGISEGIIYQKGYFLYVAPEVTVISQYSNTPDQVSVGFSTTEALINSNIDPSLLDNATGTYNSLAPGADRLQLTPGLVVINTSSATGNSAFFPITAFSNGNPYLQNQQTSYSALGNALAQRTYETSGNFVTDPFNITTSVTPVIVNNDGSINSSAQANTFTIVVDPGEAYISGYRTKTYTNYYLTDKQGTDTATANISINTNYGSYLNINEIGGIFDFSTTRYITFYDTAKQFITNAQNYYTSNTTPAGEPMGTARVRTVVPVSGIPGTNAAQNRLYIYDINMFPGKNIQNAKSVYLGSQYDTAAPFAIADIVNTNNIVLQNAANSTAVFYGGANSTKSVSNISYTYMGQYTGPTGVALSSSNGSVILTLPSGTFAFGNNVTLNANQISNVNLIFQASNVYATSNVSSIGFVTTASSNVMTLSGTGTLLSTFNTGRYLKIFSNTTGEIRRITGINATAIQLDSNLLNTNTSANVVYYFPKYVPVSLLPNSVSTDSTGTILTINLFSTALPITINGTSNAFITVPVNITSGSISKPAIRDSSVIINTSNNVSGNTGPWALGIPDIFRLKKVYFSANTLNISANLQNSSTIPSAWVDVTNQFYIDSNQNADFYDQGYLYLNPASTLNITSNNSLITVFDHFAFTTTYPLFTVSSYSTNDNLGFANLSVASNNSSINTQEIPEFYTSQGNYYDLIDCVDFRPRVALQANTYANTNGNTSLSTVNPVDYGAFQSVIATGTLNSNSTITGITSVNCQAVIISNVSVIADIAGLPGNTRVIAVLNSSSVSLSTNATTSGTANLVFTGGTVKYQSSFQFTPIDGSTYSSTITNYQGRVDRVVIDKTGNITAIPGVPGSGTLSPPLQPENSMTLNLLNIPPYPSVSQQLDSNYTAILDKGIASKNYTVQRANNHIISEIAANNSQISLYQPSAYTMEDIAALDRRIQALEYYTTLSQLETNINNLTIPSTLNSSINRFKYGIFTDNFNSTAYSDLQNPEYNAMIINDQVVPINYQNNIEFQFNGANTNTSGNTTGLFLTLPYSETAIISQLSVTSNTTPTTNSSSQPIIYNGVLTSNPTTFGLTTKIPQSTPTATGGAGFGLGAVSAHGDGRAVSTLAEQV